MKRTPKKRRKYTPLCAALEVTMRCNMACVHCGSAATRRDRPGTLKHEEWLGVIDELALIGNKYVTLSGGEPFLYPRWRELVEHAKRRGMGVNFISNGSCVTEDDVLFLKSQGVQHVAVSLDGDEAVHDRIRRHPGSFRKIMKLMAVGRKNGFAVNAVTSVNKLNFGVREAILAAALENGVRLWQVQIVNSFGRAGRLRDKLLLDPDQYTRLCEDMVRWQKAHGDRMRIVPADSLGYFHPVTDELLGDCRWEGCNAGLFVLGIRCDGAVLGCLSLQDERFVAGNVRERRLSEIWDDDAGFAYTRRYDASRMEGSCAGCRHARKCKAGCLGQAFSVTGSIHDNPYCCHGIARRAAASAAKPA